MLQYLVFIGAALQLIGIWAYIRDTIAGETKPNRVTWLMWAIAPCIATVAALMDGVSWSVLPVFMAGFGPLLVFIVSFFNKKAYWQLGSLDYACGIFSVLALVLWATTQQPAVAILFAIASDGAAALPTLIKSWKHPESETVDPYIMGIISPLTSFFAIETWIFSAYAFPIYLIAINLMLVGAVLRAKFPLLYRRG